MQPRRNKYTPWWFALSQAFSDSAKTGLKRFRRYTKKQLPIGAKESRKGCKRTRLALWMRILLR
jgi:hypothetical protein